MRNGMKVRLLPTKAHLSAHPAGKPASRIGDRRGMTEEQQAAVLELVRAWCGRTGGVARSFTAPVNPDGSVDVVIISGLTVADSSVAEYRITKNGSLGEHLAHRE